MVYIGGNDIAGNDDNFCRSTFKTPVDIVSYIETKGCNVYLCTIAPRKDANFVPYNDVIKRECEQTSATLIEAYSSFVLGNGYVANNLFNKDKIHINRQGLIVLVSVINRSINTVKSQNQRHDSNVDE